MSSMTASGRMSPVAQARILIADQLNDQGMAILRDSGLQAEAKTGLKEDELVAIIGEYDGLIVRSATTVTPKILEAGKKLQVVGRAGVGVDNIDLKAATRLGIVVQNTPLGNITSAAEHAIGLLFAVARNIPRADQEMKAGRWSKKGLTGVEFSEKTLGIAGMGKVGAIVCRTGKALGMNVVAFDPYLTERKAEELGVTKVTLDEMLAQADFITIHSPLTPETKGMIGREQLRKMKKTARIVNAARGGIIDEAALAEALNEKVIAGAGLDVFTSEPIDTESPLLKAPNIVLTPHLGASTAEAQERVAEDIARQFVDFFKNGTIRNAVNLSVTLDPKIAPYARLAEMLGRLGAQMVKQPVRTLKVGCYGRLAKEETKQLSLSALKGLLARTTGEPVTLVNAPVLAETRGVELLERKSETERDYASLLVVAVETADGEHTLSGTCFDGREPRIVKIDDFDIDLKPERHHLIMFYPDRPGMVGKFGTILGEADINIANMAVGRRERRGQAVVALTLDDPPPGEVIERLRQAARVEELYLIELQ